MKYRNRTTWKARLRGRYDRAVLSITAGMLAAVLLAGQPSGGNLAWWGILYPEFCFAAGEEKTEDRPKISLWLAKAFERW